MSSVTKNKGSFSVKAYAGDAKTLLAFNPDKPSANSLAGFSIQCQPEGEPAYYIQNELQLKNPGDHPQDAKEPSNSSINAPIHKFRWLLNCTKRLLSKAHSSSADVYIFGRSYTDGSPGIHDVQMNQGSSGSFLNNGRDDHNNHNDIWQDGAVLVDLGQPECAACFTAFYAASCSHG